ncbi:RNA polymerase sigma factor [Methylosinus trichosporium]|uniref:RNA polymerase sigma factor n=1 Tax=Methylosinus trichosporium (strain ATCC 35070 / NCIMB 11131 / UNIQEM 75 / OB3b) TaxID=595536 RepID=A0A2D2D3L6_METT3|nr:RNA polymerase sigma factor [Methylosinus trichosporium]ATQ69591.1 RNA polymerase sigma factor [Methylosinus trichosporium OB3b]
MPDRKRLSFRELFLRNRRELLDYLTRKVGPDDAPDLLQETFVRALRHERFDAVVDPPAFLQRIAVNLSLDFLRRRKTESSYLQYVDYFLDAPSPEATPEETLAHKRKSERLAAAIAALSPRCRDVFLMGVFEDIPMTEIARRLGVSDRMARKHMANALRLCRAALD